MSSLIMLLYLSLAISCCEGRSLHTSLSHSRKDVAKMKYPLSPIKEAMAEKVHQVTTTGSMALACCCRDSLPQRKQMKVSSQKTVRSLVAENKLNEEINPNKSMASASFVEMDYPSAHLAPSVNNR